MRYKTGLYAEIYEKEMFVQYYTERDSIVIQFLEIDAEIKQYLDKQEIESYVWLFLRR
ncbi:hypothetical protein ACFL6I_03640 [candidate division KSB1 bacterium]